jgi:hypothetical protein
MSEHALDYDPLQEQIRAALSRAAGVARDLEAIVPHVPRTCRRLISGLDQDLHQGHILPQRVVRGFSQFPNRYPANSAAACQSSSKLSDCQSE